MNATTHAPPSSPIRSVSRQTVLDALDRAIPLSHLRITEEETAEDSTLSRLHLARLTGMGPTTLRRICRQLAQAGILQPIVSGGSAPLLPVRYPVLPLWEITPHAISWRLCDTLGNIVCSLSPEDSPFPTPEDRLTALWSRAAALLEEKPRYTSERVPTQPPVLLCEGDPSPWLAHLSRLTGVEPLIVLSPAEAAAKELSCLSVLERAETVLLLHVGVSAQVTLFTRHITSKPPAPFVPSSATADLTQALRDYVQDRPSAKPWEAVAAFLRDLNRFIRLDRVVLELESAMERPSLPRDALPPSVTPILVRYDHRTLTLAGRGALRLSRRALWDRMAEGMR